jgi:hypothetical protein
LPAPADFRVTHGQISDTLNVHVARLPNASSYEVQTAQGDPAIDSNWQHAISSVTARHILIAGLTPRAKLLAAHARHQKPRRRSG